MWLIRLLSTAWISFVDHDQFKQITFGDLLCPFNLHSCECKCMGKACTLLSTNMHFLSNAHIMSSNTVGLRLYQLINPNNQHLNACLVSSYIDLETCQASAKYITQHPGSSLLRVKCQGTCMLIECLFLGQNMHFMINAHAMSFNPVSLMTSQKINEIK